MVARWRAPADRELRLADVDRPPSTSEAPGAVLPRPRRAHRRAGGQRTIASLDVAQCVVRIDGADDDENGRLGTIEIAVEAQQLLARQRAKSRLAPDPPAANPVTIVQHFVQRL